jgi:putative transport protein
VEVDDGELLDIEIQFLDVVVTSQKIGDMTPELAISDLGQEGRGIFARKVMRAGREMPFTVGFRLYRGDTLTLADAKGDVERVATGIGYADRPTEKSDLLIVGFGIFVGGLIGAGPAFMAGLQTQGLELFTVGVVVATIPLIGSMPANTYSGWKRRSFWERAPVHTRQPRRWERSKPERTAACPVSATRLRMPLATRC